MNDERDTTNDGTGEPVRELAELREEPSARFLAGVMDGVNARQTSARAVEMSFWGISEFFLEMLGSFFQLLGVRDERRDKE
ncbi:MAG: hypothetical protein U0704_03715 [Candidatus Eisenbacteria bacterium]